MTNFERTLRIIEDNLQARLQPGYHRIWVQGCNRPSMVTILFTIFNRDGYQMRFIDIRNFRQYRPDAENQEAEMEFINRHIESFRLTLQEFINY